MFEIYPGFEELSLRVEVEWREQTRTVIARLEQWPDSQQAVLVGTFEGNESEGEWLVIGSGGLIPYQMDNPRKMLREDFAYDIATRKPKLSWKTPVQKGQRISTVVSKAFGRNENYTVARLFHLNELASQPRTVLQTLRKSAWMPNYSYASWIEFEERARPHATEIEERQHALREWHDAQSSTRFAWQWAQLSNEQRKSFLGFNGDTNELSRVMLWILVASTRQWQEQDLFLWSFDVINSTGQFRGRPYNVATFSYLQSETDLLWEKTLLAHYAPDWRADWVKKHRCIRQWLDSQYHDFGEAEIKQPPTAHEQIEAKLALRDWLRDAATPDVAAVLLASLDD